MFCVFCVLGVLLLFVCFVWCCISGVVLYGSFCVDVVLLLLLVSLLWCRVVIVSFCCCVLYCMVCMLSLFVCLFVLFVVVFRGSVWFVLFWGCIAVFVVVFVFVILSRWVIDVLRCCRCVFCYHLLYGRIVLYCMFCVVVVLLCFVRLILVML